MSRNVTSILAAAAMLVASLSSVHAQTPMSPLPISGKLVDMAVADLNGDGLSDAAVVTASPEELVVMVADGSGGFLRHSRFALRSNSSPSSIAAGDFDGDGLADLAVAMSGNDHVQIFLSSRRGLYQGPILSVGSRPMDVMLADFDGDGLADVATANHGSNDVTIVRNDPRSGHPARSYTAGNGPHQLAAGDFNRDGRMDLAVSNAVSRDLTLLNNAGRMAFAPTTMGGIGWRPGALVARDLDGDGTTDLAVTVSETNVNAVIVWSSPRAFGPLSSRSWVSLPGMGVSALDAGDLDGDGSCDLVAANAVTGEIVMLSQANGGFVVAGSPGTAAGPVALALADIEADGDLDVVVLDRKAGTLHGFVTASTVSTRPATAAPAPGIINPVTRPVLGDKLVMDLSAPSDAGKAWFCGLAFDNARGIALPDGRIIPLDADALLAFSADPNNGLMADQYGVLDRTGRGTVSVKIPADRRLSGVSFVAAFIVFDTRASSGISTISQPVRLVIQ